MRITDRKGGRHEGLPVKKYIHLKPLQPRYHYQKIKQSLHIVLLFGAVPWAWTPVSSVSSLQVCHPGLPPVSHWWESGGRGQADGTGSDLADPR